MTKGRVVIAHPSYYLARMIRERGIPLERFALEAGTDLAQLDSFMHAYESVTPDLAKRLAKATGTSEALWLGYQKDFDDALAIESRVHTPETLLQSLGRGVKED